MADASATRYDPDRHHRRSVRLNEYDYTRSGRYLVTICSHDREHLFGDVTGGRMILNSFGDIVAQEWLRTATVRAYVELDEWIVMPNHMHGIVVLITYRVGPTRRVAHPARDGTRTAARRGPAAGSLGAIVGQFKSAAARRINVLRESPGVPMWQRSFHDRIVRDPAALQRIRGYIRANPAAWAEDRYR